MVTRRARTTRGLALAALCCLTFVATPAGASVRGGTDRLPGLGPVRSVRSIRTDGPWTSTECGTFTGTGCAPSSARVDLTKPTFTRPTQITNPLFPINTIDSVVLTGHVGSAPFRSETTVLPTTGTVDWDGKHIEVVLSQYLAFLDGHVEEMALDRYAQADDGSVWYLGEDVFDYVDGTIEVSEGTWLAGRDGPPAMIMPAHPAVGDVFRSENVTGVVFEELRVTAVNQTVRGPSGPVAGAVVMDELHVDGATRSGKVFAPGYGEFRTTDRGELEAVAVASRTDARPGGIPAGVASLKTGAFGVLENARLRDWEQAAATVTRLRKTWKALRASSPPPRVARDIGSAQRRLADSVERHRAASTETAALDVAQGALDLELLTAPQTRVDIERVHLHAQRLRVDAAAKRAGAVGGEVATLEWIAPRLVGRIPAAAGNELAARLRDLRAASDASNLRAAADHAARLAAWLRGSV